jgi:gamma-butyrobetaine dioxygenase
MLGLQHDGVVNNPSRSHSNDTMRRAAEVLSGDERLARVLDRLRLGIDRRYPGELVTQWEHALQTAALAQQARASDALVTAALLHDIGHLDDEWVDAAWGAPGQDGQHEMRGAHLLAGLFGPEVTEPIRLHVQAKRYLVSGPNGYASKLSADSQRSLALQGGPMTPEEMAAFDLNPHAADALRLRCWDDLAKDPTIQAPPLQSFNDALGRSLRRPEDTAASA